MSRVFAGTILAAVLALGGCIASEETSPMPDQGAPDAGAPSSDGDLLPFMSECTANDECDTGLCFEYGNKGPHCTHDCTVDTDCEAPSPGCNNKGVCKAPDPM